MTGQARGPRELHRSLAKLVESSSDGQVTAEQAERAESLVLAGVDSLSSLRLIDAVEREYGVPLAVEQDAGYLDSVAGIATYLLSHGLASGPVREDEPETGGG